MTPEKLLEYMFSPKYKLQQAILFSYSRYITSDNHDVTFIKVKSKYNTLDGFQTLTLDLNNFNAEFRFLDSQKDLEFTINKDDFEKLLLTNS